MHIVINREGEEDLRQAGGDQARRRVMAKLGGGRGGCLQLEDLAGKGAGVLALADRGCWWLTEAPIVWLPRSGGVCHGEEGGVSA